MIGVKQEESSFKKITVIFITGTIVHALYLLSVFDVYFTSPLVHGVPGIPTDNLPAPPAKRLVLFIADGLRVDRLLEAFENDSEYRAPYLREIVERRGSWGISHGRAPTETRPGHVAVISGFYEDMASITKGWKENAVEFDSFFNQSHYTWAWGAPDAVVMFTKTTGIEGRIFGDVYSSDLIDLASRNATHLDQWTFEHASTYMSKANESEEVMQKLQKSKITFMLHFLGLDAHGHGAKPHSKEYRNNINYVDGIIKKWEALFEQFYDNDGKTAYIVTADHGMTDWGSHGSGSLSETLTPLIAWGAGIQKPEIKDGVQIDGLPMAWNTLSVANKDVEQADICALMAALIGVQYPVNLVGMLPVDYLDVPAKDKALYLLQNGKQILAQYVVKETYVKEKSIWFRPFQLTTKLRDRYLHDIEDDIVNSRYSAAMDKTRVLIKFSLEGLQYYHKYDRLYLSFVMAFGFLGWILNVVVEILQETNADMDGSSVERRNLKKDRLLKFGTGVAVVVVLMLQVSTAVPFMHYLYCMMPFPLWYRLLRNRNQILRDCYNALSGTSIGKTVFRSVATLIVIELMALAFFHREVLSVLLVLGAILSFVLAYRRTGSFWNVYCVLWAVALLLLSVFPLLPVISGDENYALVAVAGLFTGAIGLTFTFLSPPKSGADAVVIVLTGTVIFCTAIRLHTARSVHLGQGLPPFNQMASWTLLCILPFVPFWSKPFLTERLLTLFLTFLSLYILTSISYEGLFFVCLSLGLNIWIWIEKHFIDMKYADSFVGLTQSSQMQNTHTTKLPALDIFDYFRIANEFIFFVVLAFFGTGNISSVNSFDPSSVFCFITVYRPFVMGLMLLIKVAIPFVIVSCLFNAMRIVININVRRVFLAAMVSTDIMALQFFFLIKDEGSWQEIGASVSNFVIVVGFILFLIPLFELGAMFLWKVDVDRSKSHQL